jgi:hypothetical protein
MTPITMMRRAPLLRYSVAYLTASRVGHRFLRAAGAVLLREMTGVQSSHKVEPGTRTESEAQFAGQQLRGWP